MIIEMSFFSVYLLEPAKNEKIEHDYVVGGRMDINEEIKSIFYQSFCKEFSKKTNFHPFQFIFSNNERKNITRDAIIDFVKATDSAKKEEISRNLAIRLSKCIDNRTHDLLFVIAYGHVKNDCRLVLNRPGFTGDTIL